MYHTLIPQSERLHLRREYRIRAAVVLCFALSLALIVGIVSLLPAFITASAEKSMAQAELQALNKSNALSGLSEAEQSVYFSEKLLQVLDEGTESARMSSYVNEIVSGRSSVKLTSVSISNNSTTSVDMLVRGTAPRREDLIAFKNRLMVTYVDGTVNLPISDLAKSTDIPFTIRISAPQR